MPLRSLSLQLYSVRHALDEDVARTVERVAAIGYTQVEASYKLMSAGPETLDAIRANGLTAPTMTSPLFDVDLDDVFAKATELGASAVIESYLPEQYWTSLDDIAKTADRLNAAAAKAADHGLRVGYHNHWWEIDQSFEEGLTALESLEARLDPRIVFELDAYWVAVGGQDVPSYVAKLADRVAFLHLKDGPVNRDNIEQKPAGQGTLPFPRIIAAAPKLEAGAVEFDEYDGDIFDGIAQAFAYLNPQVER
ncbi:sugar phosphate isomerase/epimerase family protein [Jiangella rhizosphaerae]|uniref:Sugar phosphate isomerase/epimerase n=1 Tax=Jiangella rhizosphaerae TaxID=2293569 RepID=A0A418KHK4_9ACTN|nr:sugar phosphate isomerase/epimerase [Jiangella rhizosphaerae]RIQ11550.1 sugar phosphate isomerase/epimerase [Jiangella rhizosphaerae]